MTKGIANITDFREAAGHINAFRKAIRNISIWVVIAFCIVAAFIVSNAIKVSVHNRRKEINIMKYIGATDRFIRIPFVLEGLLIGFMGAIAAFLVVFWGYFALVSYIGNQLNFGVVDLVKAGEIAPILAVLFVVFGSLIGVVGSAISMRKHLHV